jgi:Xaa-Pro dipeptidase
MEHERLDRLRQCMVERGVPALLTADPINILYATGVRNMTLFSMMGASRFAFISVDGPVVLWEFAGAEHLVEASSTVTETRTAPGITAVSGPRYRESIDDFAHEVAELMATVSPDTKLAVERFEHHVTDALRLAGVTLESATEVFVQARLIKTDAEIVAMRDAMASVSDAVVSMREHLVPGRTEVEVWAELYRGLIAGNGEYISTRLAQAGSRTFPYFNEASENVVNKGDLFCIDTDAIGRLGYGVDFSRTFICGDAKPSAIQADLFSLAREQLMHNASLLEPGLSFESFAASTWDVPDRFAKYGYYCVAHGLGLTGEYPYIPRISAQPFPLAGEFLPGMVLCVESYLGDAVTNQGVKLEDQYLITESGAELMSTLSCEL